MAFSINTNLSALQVYNSLAKINSQTQNAQLRLATLKRINSVADDISGFNVGNTLKRQTLTQQAEINNGSSAMNYLSTAESSLQQIVDKLNKVTEKYTESQDPLKLKSAIAKDINAIADEIDAIIKNTNIGGRNILANSDGTVLATNPVFKVGGDLTIDFASDDYLNVSDLDAILNGGTVTDPGVHSYLGSVINSTDPYTLGDSVSTVEIAMQMEVRNHSM
ncbi:MAG: flagellin [Ignavibacteriales bacterium]|nr:MAG: flagellin [Ignavibacteriales bacterium]